MCRRVLHLVHLPICSIAVKWQKKSTIFLRLLITHCPNKLVAHYSVAMQIMSERQLVLFRDIVNDVA